MSHEHILVDGYSMLHQCAELKPARLRSLAAGRQALILLLTHFHDSHGGELTVVFDGRSLPRGGEGVGIAPEISSESDAGKATNISGGSISR